MQSDTASQAAAADTSEYGMYSGIDAAALADNNLLLQQYGVRPAVMSWWLTLVKAMACRTGVNLSIRACTTAGTASGAAIRPTSAVHGTRSLFAPYRVSALTDLIASLRWTGLGLR